MARANACPCFGILLLSKGGCPRRKPACAFATLLTLVNVCFSLCVCSVALLRGVFSFSVLRRRIRPAAHWGLKYGRIFLPNCATRRYYLCNLCHVWAYPSTWARAPAWRKCATPTKPPTLPTPPPSDPWRGAAQVDWIAR